MMENVIKDVVTVRHVVSLAGVVQEQVEDQNGGAANHPLRQAIPRRIAGAHVRILAFAAPLDFQSRVLARLEAHFANSFRAAIDDLVALLDKGQLPDLLRTRFLDHHQSLSPRAFCAPIEAQSTWKIVDGGKAYEIWRLYDKLHVYFSPRAESGSRRRSRQRIDQTWSQSDGIFFFVDLPAGNAGESYRLRISMPNMGTRCGTEETGPIQVHANPEGQPVQVVWAPITLAPTRIRGTAKYREDSKEYAVAGARVSVRGETTHVLTKEDGSFVLSYLAAGSRVLEVVAANFNKFAQPVEIIAGQSQEVKVQLQPIAD